MTLQSALTFLYHDVTEPDRFSETGFQGPLADTYKLSTSDFLAHLDAIAAVRSDAPILIDAASLSAARTPWLLTFDDGGITALEPIASSLEQRGWRGHFFITTGRTGTPGFLSQDQVRTLRDRGHCIGAHSVTHPARMADLDDASMLREWKDSRDALESMLSAPVRVGSVPGGLYSDRVASAAAKAGLDILFNSEPTRGIRTQHGCTIVGRYSFKTSSTTRHAAQLAAEDARMLVGQWCAWNAKSAVKRISPRGFRALRRLLTGRD
ncbi:MAG: polysaccharide deacetylase family protein [Phycisphaerae bacterium]|nr:polysaccharide deacetylase family protein [Gemmatimonadaceae bacterium]